MTRSSAAMAAVWATAAFAPSAVRPSFEKEHRFFPGHLPGDLEKPFGLLDAFQVDEDGLGFRILG